MFRLSAMSISCIGRMAFVGLMAICCCVHAANYRPNSKAAGEDLFVTGIVPRLSIEIPPDSLKTLQSYHQVWRQARPERVDVPITVREGNLVYTNVAVHLKGSFSYRDVDSKPSLTLNFDKLAPGQRFHGLQKIHLNNAVQDPSYLLEQFGRELFNKAGVPTTRAGHAVVTINGREAGLYVLLEGWNKQFIKRHFQSAKGNLYDGGSGGDITKRLKVDCGDHPEDRSDLTNLVRAAREKYVTNRLEKMTRALDVERFRTFAALETMLVHWDGYCAGGPNNYRLFHDVARDKMVFMPHGMDQLFGVSSSTDFSILPAFKGMVADKLFSIPAERQRYRDEVARLLGGLFSVENLHARMDRLSERLQKQLADEPGLRSQVKAYVGPTKSRMQVRVASIQRQLNQPEKTFGFDKTGTAQLTAWRFKGANDHPAVSARMTEGPKQLLQIRARGDGEFSSGAWRMTVLLEPGHYVMTGMAKAVGVSQTATNTGVIMRISGSRSLRGLTTNGNWTPLRYEFDVDGISNKELVCEFRGEEGSGVFDLNTLKLARKGGARDAKEEEE